MWTPRTTFAAHMSGPLHACNNKAGMARPCTCTRVMLTWLEFHPGNNPCISSSMLPECRTGAGIVICSCLTYKLAQHGLCNRHHLRKKAPPSARHVRALHGPQATFRSANRCQVYRKETLDKQHTPHRTWNLAQRAGSALDSPHWPWELSPATSTRPARVSTTVLWSPQARWLHFRPSVSHRLNRGTCTQACHGMLHCWVAGAAAVLAPARDDREAAGSWGSRVEGLGFRVCVQGLGEGGW